MADSPFARVPLIAFWIAAFVVLALLSAVVPPLSVPACVVLLVLFLSLPEARGTALWLGRAAVAAGVLGCLVGLVRFATSKAMLGIVETGDSATAQSALSRVREIVTAEDAARLTAPFDPDHDRVGSALLLPELADTAPFDVGRSVDPALLNDAYRASMDTPLGRAVRVEGYLYIVCLPTTSGGFSARRQGIDAERSERRFLVYAWPSELAKGMTTAFFSDEHERIFVLDLPRGTPPRYLGASNPPPCNAALGAPGDGWTSWHHKAPRKILPGDDQAPAPG